MRTVAIIPFSPSLSPVPTAPQGPCEPQTCDSTEGGGRKETVSKSQKYIKTAVTFPQHPPLPMSVAHHPSKKKTVRAGKRRCPRLQARSGEVPPAWEWKAANSLYRFAATVDEGAAGRPEVQEGQAGCSGRSGLATGTENRREMKRGKRGRETAQQAGKGEKREGRRRAGLGETPQVTPLWWGGHNRRVTTDAAIRVDCMKETGPLAWGRGRKGNYAKATVTVQRTEGREEGKSQSRHHQAAGTSKTRKNGCVPECLEPAKCWREPSLVPSRAPWEGRCALKKG